MEYLIRFAKSSDGEEIYNIIHSNPEKITYFADWNKNFEELLSQKYIKILVIQKSMEIAGVCMISIIRKLGNSANAVVEDLVIKESYRRNKVGTHLLKEALDFLKHHAIHELDISVLKNNKTAQNFLKKLYKRPEIESAFTFFTANTPSYQVDVDRDKVKQLGVSIADVYSTLSTYLGSGYINDFNLYGRNFKVVTQADSSFRSSLSELQKYYVRNSEGNMIPLSSLITSTVIESPTLISHYNVYRSIEINGSAKPGYSSGQAIDALKETAAKYLPVGYGYEFSGMSSEEIKAGSRTITIFSISILFLFLFLPAFYESWSVRFSVSFSLPLT
jgi:ribosomal protein S18 acetylase RimI-like enzyme